MKRLPIACLLLVFTALPVLADEEAEKEAATRVPEVSVTETRNPRDVKTLTGNVTIRDAEEVRERGAWTLEEAIRDVPSVDVIGSSRYGQEVVVQTRGVTSGYSTQRVLVLLDGRALTDEYTGNVDVAQFPTSWMRSIEVVRGPASAVYGTNALGGVINYLPRRGGETPVTELYAEGGSFGTWNAGFSHGRMIGEVDVFVSVNSTETNGYLDNSAGDNMDWEASSGFLNLGWETERFTIRTYQYVFGGEGTDESFDRDIDRWTGDLIATHDLVPELDAVTTLRLYRNDYDQTLEWFFIPETDFDQQSNGVILTQTVRPLEGHLVTGGGEWRWEDVDVSELAGDVDESVDTWSLFLEDEWEITPDVSFVAGVRYDKREHIDGEFSWRTGVNWRATEDLTFRAAGGKAFRAPTLSDQYLPTTQFFGVTFEGNPELDPETLVSVEAGVDYTFLDDYTASVTAFASNADDYWDFIMESDGVFRPQNITEVEIRGFEVFLTADLGWGLTADAGYTYTDATYEDFEGNEDVEDNRIDGNVKHVGTASVTWTHEQGHMIRLSTLISGDRVTDPENTIDEKLDGYFIFDLNARYVVTDWAELTLSVQNLFNHRYAVRAEYKAPERGVFVGGRVSF